LSLKFLLSVFVDSIPLVIYLILALMLYDHHVHLIRTDRCVQAYWVSAYSY
jgi:hypothetical protein